MTPANNDDAESKTMPNSSPSADLKTGCLPLFSRTLAATGAGFCLALLSRRSIDLISGPSADGDRSLNVNHAIFFPFL
jgi:hypothetical protein